MVRQRPPDYLPRQVLTREDFVGACGSRDLGRILEIAIKWGGAGFTSSHVARRCEMTVSQVQDYVRRGRQALSIEIFERVADGLQIPGGMLGIGARPWEGQGAGEPGQCAHRDRVVRAPWTVGGTLIAATDVSEAGPMERRSFMLLTGMALTSPAHEWLIARPVADVSSPAGRTIEPALVDHLDEMTGRFRRMDDLAGGGSLVDAVCAQAKYVAGLLTYGRYTDSTGRRLHGTLGELLRLAGWVTYDGDGDPGRAQRFWIAALHCAHTAGDSALGANVLGFMSEPARDAGRFGDAVTLTATALAGYTGASPHVHAILQMRAALALAASGDVTECRRAIDSAQHSLGKPLPQSGEPDWCYWMDEGMLNQQVGSCLMRLGEYPLALEHYEWSLRGEKIEHGTYAREGVLRLTRLATACARQGEPERACDAAGRAIDLLTRQVDSARLVTGIRRLRGDLAPYRDVPAVAEFTERVSSVLSTQ